MTGFCREKANPFVGTNAIPGRGADGSESEYNMGWASWRASDLGVGSAPR